MSLDNIVSDWVIKNVIEFNMFWARDDNMIQRVARRSPTSFSTKIRTSLLLKGTDVHRTTVSRGLLYDFNLKSVILAKNFA